MSWLQHQDAPRFAWIEHAARDMWEAVRMWRSTPGFTTVAVFTLALGIGATTAIFTLIQQVMLRSLPVTRPEELWRVGDAVRCCYRTGYAQDDWSFFPSEAYAFFRANTPAFEQVAAFQVGTAELGVRRTGSRAPVWTANGEFVSGNFFRTFGVSAWRGRLFADADDRAGAAPAAVMSFHTWQGKYGSDPSVVGASYEINGRAFTIVGVAPPGFFGAKVATSTMPDVWLPLAIEPLIQGATSRLDDPRSAWLDVIGRVRPGTPPATLEAQLQVELHQWLATHVADMTPQEKIRRDTQTVHLVPGGAGVSLMRQAYQSDLQLLMLAAACVLLLAGANVANLLLARGLRRRHQTALRAALGASRGRLVRQALAESLTLALFGGVAGVVVAYAGTSLILRLLLARPDTWVPVEATPSLPVLLFALAVAVITGVVFGVAPALTAVHVDPSEAFRRAKRATGDRHRAQKTLVIVQAAVSLVLLSAAAMLGQSVQNLEHQNFGFDVNGRYLIEIDPKLTGRTPEQLAPVLRDVQDRLRGMSGVRMAALALYAPMSGLDWHHAIRIAGKPEPAAQTDDGSGWTRVSPGFFQTIGDRIVLGRPIADEDTAEARRVAVVNEAFATQFFGDDDPIGQHFGPAPGKNAGAYEIVGVAANVRFFDDVRNPIGPMYFVPQAQTMHFDDSTLEGREVWSHYPYSIVIWAPGNPAGLGGQLRQVLADLDVPLYGVEPYVDVIAADFSQPRMIASLTWMFGALGLVLAAVGLYGVTSYGVEQRTREIGVRMALGADGGSVVRMILRGACWQVGTGLALGIPLAIGAGDLIASQLFDVRPWDPVILASATVLLATATLIAALVPARRATTVDPMIALACD